MFKWKREEKDTYQIVNMGFLKGGNEGGEGIWTHRIKGKLFIFFLKNSMWLQVWIIFTIK